MTDKLDLYDLIGSVVLGVLLVCWVPVCFPSLTCIRSPHYTDAFAATALGAVSVVSGQLIQALASLTEPLLFRTFGGRPSDVALARGLGLRYFPADAAERIRAKLRAAVGDSASDSSLFHYAMQRSDALGVGRAPRFNSWYAYHRGLLTLLLGMSLMLVASARFGAAMQWPTSQFAWTVAALTGASILAWHRTRQRAFYYVREVLVTAERVLDERAAAGPGQAAAKG